MLKKKIVQIEDKDLIVEEVRKNRAEILKEFDGNIDAIYQHAKANMEKYGVKFSKIKPVKLKKMDP